MKLSEFIKELMCDLVIRFFKSKNLEIKDIIQSTTFDREECSLLLLNLTLSEKNVKRYLKGKYKHIYKNGIISFPTSKCILSGSLTVSNMLLKFNNSEPHKIITDIYHVLDILSEINAKAVVETIDIEINMIKLQQQDVFLYTKYLIDNGYLNELLERIKSINRRSIRRKFLRYLLYEKRITPETFTLIKNG